MPADHTLSNGRYVLQEAIGKGANAVVYKATDTSSNRIVAVKKITAHTTPEVTHNKSHKARGQNENHQDDESDLARWRREADLLRSLDHPNIVKYLDDFVAADNSAMYIVMEFASQGSLLSLLRRSPGCQLPVEVAAKYLYQIICGLAYLHHRRVLHRDIKAANVLLDDKGVAKLTDFGLATPKEATGEKNEHLSMLAGSVYWMSPESISQGRQSEAGDIWSLGCTALELVTGQPPFFDRQPVNALYHIATELHESPVPHDTDEFRLSENLRDFLTQCLQRNAVQRPKASALLQHPWFRECGVVESGLVNSAFDSPRPLSSSQIRWGSPASKPLEFPSAVGSSKEESVASLVESYLFGEHVDQRDIWLRSGGLTVAVDALPTITAEESYRVVRSLAFASQRAMNECPYFFNALGDTNLWQLDLTVLATMDNVGSLFCDCCDHQSPTVKHYALSSPHALRLVLRRADIGPQCIGALHRLMVSRNDVTSAPSETGDEHNAPRAYRRSQYVPPTVSSELARARFAEDNAPALLREILQEVCLQSFRDKSEPPMRWAHVDKLFETLLSFDADPASSDSAPQMGENWLIAVQQACVHHCRGALRLLVHSVNGPGRILSGEKVIVGRLIAVAADPMLDFETRLEVANVLPVLQRHYVDAAAAMRDLNGNVPLLTHIVRYMSPTPGSVDHMLAVLVKLCEDAEMATACASYDGMLMLMQQKIVDARTRKSPICLDKALQLAEQLFACSPQPEWFVTSRQLTKVLVEIVSAKGPANRDWTVAQGLAHESSIARAQRLLDALAAQSLSV